MNSRALLFLADARLYFSTMPPQHQRLPSGRPVGTMSTNDQRLGKSATLNAFKYVVSSGIIVGYYDALNVSCTVH